MGVIRLKILNRIAKITFVIILENIMNFKKHFQILNLLVSVISFQSSSLGS